jgi:uncharacterized protein (DUF849 family)
MEFLPAIRDACDAVINITTGGGHNMTVQERLAAPLQCQPEMCSFNMGSMNFGLYPNLDKYKEFKHEWEPQYLEASRDFIFRNTFKDMEYTLKHLGEGCGTRFEFECYDVGHLYNLAHLLERKLVKPPLSSRRFSAYSAASAPIRTISCTCEASRTSSSATTTSGRCSPPAATRWR